MESGSIIYGIVFTFPERLEIDCSCHSSLLSTQAAATTSTSSSRLVVSVNFPHFRIMKINDSSSTHNSKLFDTISLLHRRYASRAYLSLARKFSGKEDVLVWKKYRSTVRMKSKTQINGCVSLSLVYIYRSEARIAFSSKHQMINVLKISIFLLIFFLNAWNVKFAGLWCASQTSIHISNSEPQSGERQQCVYFEGVSRIHRSADVRVLHYRRRLHFAWSDWHLRRSGVRLIQRTGASISPCRQLFRRISIYLNINHAIERNQAW